MAVDGSPSPGELMRRMDELFREVREMRREAQERAVRDERTFVRVDVFEARQAADLVQINGLEAEVHSLSKRLEDAKATAQTRLDEYENRQRTMRALVFSALIAPLLIALITAAVLNA